MTLSACLAANAVSWASITNLLSFHLGLPPNLFGWLLVLAAGYFAGAINSVAGGGSLLTFPALMAAGVPPLVANATNCLALVPSQLASAYGYRSKLKNISGTLATAAVPSLLGGLIGGALLLCGGETTFKNISPWLIVFACALIFVQGRMHDKTALKSEHSLDQIPMGASAHAVLRMKRMRTAALVPIILIIATYGSYFGGGAGFLMLAALGFGGLSNIYQMNGVRSILGGVYNGVAAFVFVCAGRIDWLAAAVVISGMVLGALSGSNLALKLGPRRVQQLVIFIGLTAAVWVFQHRC